MLGLRAFNLTVGEGILLHLFPYRRSTDAYTVPLAVSQEGIARRLDISRGHVSSTLKTLKERGLVEERLCHIKSIPRKRKSYFLTDAGIVSARALKRRLRAIPLTVIEGTGEERETTIGRYKKDDTSLSSSSSSVLDIVLGTNADMVLDLRRMEENEAATAVAPTEPAEERKATPTVVSELPSIVHFFGRKKELAQLHRWLASDQPHLIVVVGIAGIGKTTLVAKLVTEHRERRSIFWHRIHSWETLRNIVDAVAAFLRQLERHELALYIENARQINLGDLKPILDHDLGGLDALFVFDDCHEATEEIVQFISLLKEILPGTSGVKALLTSRRPVPCYDRREVVVTKTVAEYQLKGLDEASARQLLDLDRVDDFTFASIYDNTEGHPLILELISTDAVLDDGHDGQKDVRLYLRDEIFRQLDEREKALLGLLSLFRSAAPLEALYAVAPDLEYETVERLIDRNLVKATTAGYDIHSLLREFFSNRLNPVRARSHHAKIGDYYRGREEDRAPLDAVYHLLKGGQPEPAQALILDHGRALVQKGYHREVLSLLTAIENTDLDPVEEPAILLLKGIAYTFSGQWKEAMDHYQRALDGARDAQRMLQLATAYNCIGAVHYRRGDWIEARRCYKAGLDALEAMDAREETTVKQTYAKLLSNIGLIDWEEEKWERAIECHRETLELSRALDDPAGIARAYTNIGNIYWSKGEIEAAIENYRESLELIEASGDERTLAIVYNNLGEAYRANEERAEAIHYYKQSLALAKKLGFKWQIGEVYRNLGQVVDDRDEAYYYLTLSSDIYHWLGAEKEVERVAALMAALDANEKPA